MRYRILLLAAIAACGGGAAPKVTADPARGLRTMTTEDPELTAIAVAAARALPLNGTAQSVPFFGGVFVDGRKSRPASDAVVRATGFPAGSSSTRRPQVRCEARSSSGQTREVPCPPQTQQMLPPTYIFEEVRATADSAYVGITETMNGSSKGSCVTLVKRGASWDYLGSTVIASPRNCGKSTTDSEREVRLLEADDIALRPVVFAAAKHIFDPKASQPLSFGGVYVKKVLVPSLTGDVSNYIYRNGGFQQQLRSRPADCDAPAVEAQRPPRGTPTTGGTTGGAPNPPAQPKRTIGAAICNGGTGFAIGYTFTAVRIASDTAYLELDVTGTAKSTKCLSLTVDQVAGGWLPGEMKNTKIGRCGA